MTLRIAITELVSTSYFPVLAAEELTRPRLFARMARSSRSILIARRSRRISSRSSVVKPSVRWPASRAAWMSTKPGQVHSWGQQTRWRETGPANRRRSWQT